MFYYILTKHAWFWILKAYTSELSSCIISYMSKSTNNFSGDLLLLAIASPKLSNIDTLLVVTSAKHWSLSDSKPSNIWSQTFLSPANSNFTCLSITTIQMPRHETTEQIQQSTYSYTHEMNPISNFGLQNLPL